MTVFTEFLDEPQILGTTDTQIGGAVPVGERWVLSNLVLCNTTSSNATATVYLVDTDAPTAKHQIVGGMTIPANQTRAPQCVPLAMAAGWSIWAKAGTAGAITINALVRKEKP